MEASLKLYKKTYGELGRRFNTLSFESESHPLWRDLITTSTDLESAVLIDNTTVRNALILMKEGLGSDNSFHAALLPDFATFFFALTHFEEIILLDHGLDKSEREEIDEICGGLLFRTVVWTDAVEELRWDLLGKFNSIQADFKSCRGIHNDWSSAWSILLNNDGIKPRYFIDRDLDKLIDTPENPLDDWASDLSRSFLEALQNKRGFFRLLWLENDLTFELSVFASYHTFRTIFYHNIAEFLRIPYLSCGVRGVASNFVPIRYLNQDTDFLNPKIPLTLEWLSANEYLQNCVVEIPFLKLTPTLAVVFEEMEKYHTLNWPNIVQELRIRSAAYRKEVARFINACRASSFDLKTIKEIAKAISGDGAQVLQNIGSTVQLAGSMTAAYATQNPASTIKSLGELLKVRPWEIVKNGMQRHRLKFILRAADLATHSLSLEHRCSKIWQREFTMIEKEYLHRLERIVPSIAA